MMICGVLATLRRSSKCQLCIVSPGAMSLLLFTDKECGGTNGLVNDCNVFPGTLDFPRHGERVVTMLRSYNIQVLPALILPWNAISIWSLFSIMCDFHLSMYTLRVVTPLSVWGVVCLVRQCVCVCVGGGGA